MAGQCLTSRIPRALTPLTHLDSSTCASARLAPRCPASSTRKRARYVVSASALPSVHLDSSSLAVVGDLSTTLFALGQRADELVNASLSDVTPVTYAVVLVRVLHEVDRFPCAERATPLC